MRRYGRGTGLNWKIFCRTGRETAAARNRSVPPMTHQKALFGLRRVLMILSVHDRFVQIRARSVVH
jgi:hypothetical protein